MNLEDSGGAFKTTHWTLLDALRQGTDSERTAAADLIYRTYLPSIRFYLRSHGLPVEEADELAQDFYVTKIVQGGLLNYARKERGRLRSLMLSALRNYRVDKYRQAKGRTEGPMDGRAVGIDEGADSPPDAKLEAEFQANWACGAVSEALARCERHYRSGGMTKHWLAYYRRVVLPAMRPMVKPTRSQLAKELGFRTSGQVSAAVQTVTKMVRTILREVIAETVTDPEELEDEVEKIMSYIKAERR